ADHQPGHGLDQRWREDAEAEPPAGHRERLRPAVEQDRAVGHAVDVEDARVRVLAVPYGPVHLVGEHGQIVALRDVRDRLAIRAGERAAARVVRRVDDEQLRAVGDQPFQLVGVDTELVALAQWYGDRLRARERGNRLVHREAGVRV